MNEFIFLEASFVKLNDSVQCNVHCHHESILNQLSQIKKILSFGSKKFIAKQCDALLDAGVIKTIVKLLNRTNNKKIIVNCFYLCEMLTFHARKTRFVTNDYVSIK